jgi:lipopolysaccharide/colanic/teichoic acid biosynthesis glycosyltransferase
VKRAFDVALAGASLIASTPLWIIFAAAIKLHDGGQVFLLIPLVGL